ncbi:hypothetical protein JCM10213_003133 [Rhodosporidiobolus nylandii]
MANLSALPLELLITIVELAVPPFSYDGWWQRAVRLRHMSLTCKVLHVAAWKVLHGEMVLKKWRNVEALIEALKGSERIAGEPVEAKTLLLGWKAGYDYEASSSDSDSDDYTLSPGPTQPARDFDLPDLFRLAKPAVVGMRNLTALCPSDLRGLDETSTLLLEACELEAPGADLLRRIQYSSIRRLDLHGVHLPSPAAFLSRSVFPNLRSLALTSSTFPGSNGRTRDLHARTADIPILSQLQAVSAGFVEAGSTSTIAVADIFLDPNEPISASLWPSSIQVLRLVRASHLDSSKALKHAHDCLVQPGAYPLLQEVHLVGLQTWLSEEGQRLLADLELWAEKRGIRLFKQAVEDDMMSFSSTFWRFLDGVKSRTGLAV